MARQPIPIGTFGHIYIASFSTSDAPLGTEPATSYAQGVDAARAVAALHKATPPEPMMPSAPWHDAGNEPTHGIDL